MKKTPTLASKRRTVLLSGFTLMELLVVIAIIALLAALIFPAISRALASARLTKSLSNVRQIYSGFMLYAHDHNQVFPAAWHTHPDWWMAPRKGVPEYLYPGRDLVVDKRGTVFQSPNAEPDGTFGGRTISYGINLSLEGATPTRRFLLLERPEKTLLLSDASFSHSLWRSIDGINYRNDGRAVCVFVNGHITALTPEQVEAYDGRLFWTGIR
jgi:prepilin-type N-terminal cleavage/methylation domain-containing protein